ncbi:pheromone alpha factor receptor [Coniosporium apollinis]|uniref:Pheromone alpha factor receptor n=2 Tax=Coniosporium TaxID=2810619 RepID=A0ABQ9NVK4_9PEZI|nr:pheromone alpha factor receptor [Cladosporium sp. JES 115]KAJ9665299.1 pheromone alpha factor receptor [Coniosporium apollinis]
MDESLDTPMSTVDFDPFHQAFTIVLPDGTPFNLTIDDINTYTQYGIRITINFSSQIGACLMVLIVLLMLTKQEKRRSPIFILNALALALGVIRNVLLCLYFTGPWYHPYAFFAQDYSRVPQTQYGVSITSSSLTLVVLILVEISLILQIRVMCVTATSVLRFWITVLSITIAMIAIGFRFAYTVLNAIAIRAVKSFMEYQWLGSATNITTTISICVFSAVFTARLGLAIRQRKRLGLRQFGPMQILFVMGCQTMIIPACFSLLQYIANESEVPYFSAQVLTVVSIFLPLSSLWASASLDDNSKASSGPDAHRTLLKSDTSGGTSGTAGGKNSLTTDTTASRVSTLSPGKARKADDDLEAGDVDGLARTSSNTTNEKN